MNRLTLTTTGALLACSLTLAACGGGGEGGDVSGVADGSWDDVVAAAKEEGRLNLYSVAPPYQNDRLIEAFKEEYPEITVDVTRGAGELPARVASEIQAGADGADVFIYTDPKFFVDNAADMLDIDGPSVDGWADDFWADKGTSIIPTKYPWTMLVWNTELFPEGFENWDDLLAPEVAGRLAMRNDLTTSMAATLEFMEDELGEEYLTELGQQRPKFYQSAVPMGQAVASGEAGVTNVSTPSIVQDLQNQGAPVDYVFPAPGFSIGWGAGAIRTAQRPNAASLFIDFMMSEAGQEAINSDGLGAAGREGVEGALDLEGWTFFDSEQYTPERIREVQQRFDTYFG